MLHSAILCAVLAAIHSLLARSLIAFASLISLSSSESPPLFPTPCWPYSHSYSWGAQQFSLFESSRRAMVALYFALGALTRARSYPLPTLVFALSFPPFTLAFALSYPHPPCLAPLHCVPPKPFITPCRHSCSHPLEAIHAIVLPFFLFCLTASPLHSFIPPLDFHRQVAASLRAGGASGPGRICRRSLRPDQPLCPQDRCAVYTRLETRACPNDSWRHRV
jgi:hypothetical protein